MSKSTHTLKVQKGSTTYTCDLYTTTAEAAIHTNSSYLSVNVDNTNLYAPLYPTTYNQTWFDNYGTPVHVEKGGTEYVLAQKSLGRVGITASSHQTITVTASSTPAYSNASWTSGNRYFPYGTTWSATLTADTGWTKGTLSKSSGTVTNANVDVSATAATHKTYTITLTQKTGETVTIHYKNHNGTSLASSWSTTTSSITLGHGSQYYCTIAASTGWTAGTITSAGSSSSPNTLTAAKTISFTAATHKKYNVTLTQKSNETVTIHYRNYDGSTRGDWKTTTSTVELGHGSYVYCTIAASTGYNAGSITNVGTSSSDYTTLTGAITVAFGAATKKTYTLTVRANSSYVKIKVTYTNSSGTVTTTGVTSIARNGTKTYTFQYNTPIKITNANNDGDASGGEKYIMYIGTSASGTDYNYNETYNAGNKTANTTIDIYFRHQSSGGD